MSTPEDRASREWRELDAQDLASAIEDRLSPDQEFEQYEGPLDRDDWLYERGRREELERLGIERPELPEPFASALGAERAWRLERQVEDARLAQAYSPRGHEALAARAREWRVTERALDVELSNHVVGLEETRDELVEEMIDAGLEADELWDSAEIFADGGEHDRLRAAAEAKDAGVQALRTRVDAIEDELRQLSGREGHPDAWLQEHGQEFADGFAATLHFRGERERAAAEMPGPESTLEATHSMNEPAIAQRTPQTVDVGMDTF